MKIAMVKIAICDDEKIEITLLTELLQSYYENECEIDFFCSGKKLLESGKHYEIYFLDINIGDISGITVAEKIRKEDVRAVIVFVTNYGDFHQRAFTVHAFEYVVKPIKKKRLYKILDEIHRYRKEDCQNKKLCFKGEQGSIRVKAGDICYFEFADRKIKMVLDDRVVWLKGTIREIENLMEKYDFVLPHKAFVVNMRKMDEIKTYDIVMSNGDIIPIAQKKASGFRKRFESYLYSQV